MRARFRPSYESIPFFILPVLTAACLAIAAFGRWAAPDWVPLPLDWCWTLPADWSAVAPTAAVLLGWGFFLNLVCQMMNRPVRVDLKEGVLGAFAISAYAGVFEELAYRWAYFLAAMFGAGLGNLLLFGFPHWFYGAVLAPVLGFLSAGSLDPILHHPAGWVVGSAMISINAKFREGHIYQGWFGALNSWVLGFILFRAAFDFGLPAAIALHFGYDLAIFLMAPILSLLRLGRRRAA